MHLIHLKKEIMQCVCSKDGQTPSELVVITSLHQGKMLTFNEIDRCIYITPTFAF